MEKDAKVVSKTIMICSYCFKNIGYCSRCSKQFEIDDDINCVKTYHYHKNCSDKKIINKVTNKLVTK